MHCTVNCLDLICSVREIKIATATNPSTLCVSMLMMEVNVAEDEFSEGRRVTCQMSRDSMTHRRLETSVRDAR